MKYLLLRVCAWLIPGAAIILTMVPPEFRPVTGISHGLEHFLWFLACGIVFGAEWPKVSKLNLYVAGAAFCAGLELVQNWIPGRHARLSDFLIDAGATAAGISLARILQSVRSSTRPVLSD